MLNNIKTIISNYYFTLVHLRFRQVFYQIHYRFKRKFYRNSKYYLPQLDLDLNRLTRFEFPLFHSNDIDANHVLTLHSHRIDLKDPNKWHDQSLPILQFYHLHYFDFLLDNAIVQNPDLGYNLILEWIDHNQSTDSIAWDSYPTSLRIVNWIKFITINPRVLSQSQDRILQSLIFQTIHLSKNLEYHLLGNHLLANLKAIYLSVHFFKTSSHFLLSHLAINVKYQLILQLNEQILKDGAHFERSFMYHSILLFDLLDIYTVAKSANEENLFLTFLSNNIQLSLDYYHRFLHPDGKIAFFNDANFSNSVSNQQIRKYSNHHNIDTPVINPKSLISKESGFAILQNSAVKIIADIGSIAPDYLPAHAHAESLSFELSLGQHRLIVNSGVGEYGQSAERLRQRGTAAHSTLRLNGENSSAVWGGFRMGKRARATAQLDPSLNQLTASHDGYRRRSLLGFARGILHHRRWHLSDSRLVVTDKITAIGGEKNRAYRVEVFYHLHPDWQVVQTAVNEFTITRNGINAKFTGSSGLNWRVIPSTYHPEFGQSIPNFCLVGEGAISLNQEISVEINWA